MCRGEETPLYCKLSTSILIFAFFFACQYVLVFSTAMSLQNYTNVVMYDNARYKSDKRFQGANVQ